jgi:hypothetical protein
MCQKGNFKEKDWTGRVAQVVEHLSSMCKAQSSNSSTTTIKKVLRDSLSLTSCDSLTRQFASKRLWLL